jgi:hypothetical protein
VIRAKRVTAPDGTTWRVGRRWLPDHAPKLRRRRNERDGGEGWLGDFSFGDVSDGLAIALALVLLAIVVILITSVVFPLLVLGAELLVIAALFVAGVTGRLVFRKPWTVRARSDRGRELTWSARGFRRSGRVRDEAAAALAHGHQDIRPIEAGD